MVTRRDYNAEMVEAARSVLIELTHLLGKYREQIVLIGGWVPEMLFPGSRLRTRKPTFHLSPLNESSRSKRARPG
jgi:hypothetical protein